MRISQLCLVTLSLVTLWSCGSSDKNLDPSITLENLSAAEGTVVQWTATATDPDGDALSFEWQQLNGPTVQVLENNGASVQISVPAVVDDTSAKFRVVVSNTKGLSQTAEAELAIVSNKVTVTLIGQLSSHVPGLYSVTAKIADREFEAAVNDNEEFTLAISVDDSEVNEQIQLTAKGQSINNAVMFRAATGHLSDMLATVSSDELNWREIPELRLSNFSTAYWALTQLINQQAASSASVDLFAIGASNVVRYATVHQLANRFLNSADDFTDELSGLNSLELLINNERRESFYTAVSKSDALSFAQSEQIVRDDFFSQATAIALPETMLTMFQVTANTSAETMRLEVASDTNSVHTGAWQCYPFRFPATTTHSFEGFAEENTLQMTPEPELYLGSSYPAQNAYDYNIEARRNLTARQIAATKSNNGFYFISIKDTCIDSFVEPNGNNLLDDVTEHVYKDYVFVDDTRKLATNALFVEGQTIRVAIPGIKSEQAFDMPLNAPAAYTSSSVADVKVTSVNGSSGDVVVSVPAISKYGELTWQDVSGTWAISNASSAIITTPLFTWDIALLDVGKPDYNYVSVMALTGGEKNVGSGLALSKSAPSAFEPGIYMQDMSHQSRLQYFALIYDTDGQYTEVSALDYNGNGRIDTTAVSIPEVSIQHGLWKKTADNAVSARLYTVPAYSNNGTVGSCLAETFDDVNKANCVLQRQRDNDFFEHTGEQYFASTVFKLFSNASLDAAQDALLLESGSINNRVWTKVAELPFEMPMSASTSNH
ncbi:hypothetical protein ORJ04_16630 [Rheinheimera baltica]|uniref:Chitinase n=1 Tax=Rheinheimera baltica TaxID=67576 RepID=A0ABT9I336_9GAMM|nr:hypothetical protein [Rheinheimera baltica]MDP5137583.1 hypothetical protein [Rheinheimera baltica]